VGYASASASIGSFTFGTFAFVYVAAAIIILVGLLLFLKRTRTGQAALAVGQNPRGAKLVGINVDRTYLLIFSISIALVGGVMGGLFLTRHSIFPLVGSSFTMKSFCLIAMAGVGNLTGVLWCSLGLGLAEAFIMSFKGYGGWADMVFFALIIIVIIVRSYQRQVA
jgi:branched-chain amino acid transport system permease protein